MLLAPPRDIALDLTYRPSPRPRRKFKTPLDAAKLIDSSRVSSVQVTRDGEHMVIRQLHPLLNGTVEETLELDVRAGQLAPHRMLREVRDGERVARREEVDFTAPCIPLPEDAYPEVMAPFLLAWQPFDAPRRAFYCWINDRFVARVQFEVRGDRRLDLPIGRRRAIEALMWPDLNDWIPLGSVLTRLSRPLLPHYHMWFAPEPPYEVLRYEGPYGPPGAPEIVLELESVSNGP